MAIEVSAGKVHLLKGPNGCGKSLLLDIVSGVHKSQRVRVWSGGQALSNATAFARWQAGIRRLFQVPTLPVELQVDQVLERFGFGVVSMGEWWREAKELLTNCGVRLNEPLGIHSFGQQRIVELIISLASGRCCLLDEPFAGLNASFLDLAAKLIRRAADDKRAILVVDHLSAHHPELYDKVYIWQSPSNDASTPISRDVHSQLNIADSLNSAPPFVGANWSVDYFRIGDHSILREVEIELRHGTLLLLTGQNGTGKSTLLRELGGYEQPWKGVSARITSDLSSERILLSPQPPKLVDELTVEENLKLMIGKGHPVKKSDLTFARELLGWLGLPQKHFKERAEVLSGGEAGKVALVGASLSPAKVLLLDEPFESFTSQSVELAIELFRAVLAGGKCVIASNHNPQLLSLVERTQQINLSSNTAIAGSWAGKPLT